MKYYAMIDGERRGPFVLDQLKDEGVTPATFVWCKGMADWERAEDVAEICRYWRQRIFDMMHPRAAQSVVEVSVNRPVEITREAYMRGFRPEEDPVDIEEPPVALITLAILVMLLCFPFTGGVALYYAIKSRKAWDSANASESKKSSVLYTPEERDQLKKEAHDYARQAKMWIGITLFLGLIWYSFIIQYAAR